MFLVGCYFQGYAKKAIHVGLKQRLMLPYRLWALLRAYARNGRYSLDIIGSLASTVYSRFHTLGWRLYSVGVYRIFQEYDFVRAEFAFRVVYYDTVVV